MKKRHLFGLFAMAAFACVSCSQDEVVSQSPDVNKAIEFGTYVGRDASSRGSVQNLTSLTATDASGFGVFAYYTNTADGYSTSTSTPNFMYNQQVTGTATTTTTGTGGSAETTTTYAWTYSPLKYWPTGTNDKLTFFAYAPYNCVTPATDLSANTAVGYPTLKFAVNETVKDQIDLLYAGEFETTLKNKTKTDDAVIFKFMHALSRIGFKVKASDDRTTASNVVDNNTQITVQSVEISFGETYLASGTLDLGLGTWSHTDVTAADQTYTLSTENLKSVTASSTAAVLNEDDSYIMIIPQDITAENITVKVVYTITTTDTNVAGGTTVMSNNILTSDSFKFNFEKGKAYNFILDLGLKTIKLSAEVDNWDTPEGKDKTDVSFGS